MYRLRTKWGKRWVVALLLASLLPLSFAMLAQTAQHTTSLADWVRAQLRDPHDEAAQQALEQAAASRVRSLEAFLKVFIAAFESQRPGTSPAHVFSALDLSDDALIAYLQSRFVGLVGDAVPPRTTLVAAHGAATPAAERGTAPQAFLDGRQLALRAWTAAWRHAARPLFVLAVRTLCTAQPLGP